MTIHYRHSLQAERPPLTACVRLAGLTLGEIQRTAAERQARAAGRSMRSVVRDLEKLVPEAREALSSEERKQLGTLAKRQQDLRQRAGRLKGRLEKAREIRDERARRGRMIETLDALQFGDLGWLAVRYDGWYEYFGVESKKQAKKLVKQLESLRNALAHSQDIVAHDWETVVAVARSVVAIKQAESAAATGEGLA